MPQDYDNLVSVLFQKLQKKRMTVQKLTTLTIDDSRCYYCYVFSLSLFKDRSSLHLKSYLEIDVRDAPSKNRIEISRVFFSCGGRSMVADAVVLGGSRLYCCVHALLDSYEDSQNHTMYQSGLNH